MLQIATFMARQVQFPNLHQLDGRDRANLAFSGLIFHLTPRKEEGFRCEWEALLGVFRCVWACCVDLGEKLTVRLEEINEFRFIWASSQPVRATLA
jgi:hypothetical protein